MVGHARRPLAPGANVDTSGLAARVVVLAANLLGQRRIKQLAFFGGKLPTRVRLAEMLAALAGRRRIHDPAAPPPCSAARSRWGG